MTAFLRGCCGDADCSVDFQKTKCVVFGREDDVDKAVVFLRALTEGMCKQWVGAPPPFHDGVGESPRSTSINKYSHSTGVVSSVMRWINHPSSPPTGCYRSEGCDGNRLPARGLACVSLRHRWARCPDRLPSHSRPQGHRHDRSDCACCGSSVCHHQHEPRLGGHRSACRAQNPGRTTSDACHTSLPSSLPPFLCNPCIVVHYAQLAMHGDGRWLL